MKDYTNKFKERKRLYKYLGFCVKHSYFVHVRRQDSNFLYIVTSYNKEMVDLCSYYTGMHYRESVEDFLRKWKPVFIPRALSNKVYESIPRHNFLVSSTYCALLHNNAKEEYARSKIYR